MYKIIACDLDETLLDSNTHVPKRNRKAIKKITQKGIKFVPATGRGYVSVAKTLKEIGLFDKPNQYVISFNGACITENKSNRIMYFQGLSFDKANELYQLGLNYDVCIHVYTKDMLYVYKPAPDEIDYLTGRHHFKIINEQNISFLKGQEIAKVLYENTDMNYLRKVAADLGKKTDDLDVSYSSNRYLEFNHSGVNKGAGLLRLAKNLGVKPTETMALGDNFNDLAMIKAAGLGVGMQNTNPRMIKQCDVITSANNNQGGVAEAIGKYVLGS